jgi:hypothetical protein
MGCIRWNVQQGTLETVSRLGAGGGGADAGAALHVRTGRRAALGDGGGGGPRRSQTFGSVCSCFSMSVCIRVCMSVFMSVRTRIQTDAYAYKRAYKRTRIPVDRGLVIGLLLIRCAWRWGGHRAVGRCGGGGSHAGGAAAGGRGGRRAGGGGGGRRAAAVALGLGRIVALHHRLSTSYQIC